jgi:hypothetical protein
MSSFSKNSNLLILKILSPLLLMLGVAGYLLPKEYSFICRDCYYNLLHINLGMMGFIMLFASNQALIRLYNIFLGFLFFYQATASLLNIFPARLFHYTCIDDIFHTDLGCMLLLVGILANTGWSKKEVKD